jgi:hypothetical protein
MLPWVSCLSGHRGERRTRPSARLRPFFPTGERHTGTKPRRRRNDTKQQQHGRTTHRITDTKTPIERIVPLAKMWKDNNTTTQQHKHNNTTTKGKKDLDEKQHKVLCPFQGCRTPPETVAHNNPSQRRKVYPLSIRFIEIRCYSVQRCV